jgi:hypothetical protein
MPNQAFNLLGSIVVLAMVSVALSPKSQTGNVLTNFFKGFSGSLTAAGNAGR